MASRPYILLVSGHRSVGDGGDSVERELTDDLARAYKAAFRADGYTTDWFQEIDNDDIATSTAGGLAGVAKGCGRVLRDRPEDLSIMLDLHFNTRRSAVHAIVAHNERQDGQDMLNSGFPEGRVAADLARNNSLDVTMAGAIAREIASIPGMQLWPGKLSGLKGVMLENETGVGDPHGDDANSRLAMMAATCPVRMKAVRITVEHGGTNDADKPDFFNNCAKATLRAINRTLSLRDAGGLSPAPDPDTGRQPGGQPDPEPSGERNPLARFLFGTSQGFQFDSSGPVSQLWLATGNQTGRYPRLADVLIDGTTKHFLFSDGSVIVANGDGPVTFLTDLVA